MENMIRTGAWELVHPTNGLWGTGLSCGVSGQESKFHENQLLLDEKTLAPRDSGGVDRWVGGWGLSSGHIVTQLPKELVADQRHLLSSVVASRFLGEPNSTNFEGWVWGASRGFFWGACGKGPFWNPPAIFTLTTRWR